MDNRISTRMENCHSRLIKIRDELSSKELKNEESKNMLIIAERITLISQKILSELNEERKWSQEDRTGFKRFLFECEGFIKLNIELLLPRHL